MRVKPQIHDSHYFHRISVVTTSHKQINYCCYLINLTHWSRRD